MPYKRQITEAHEGSKHKHPKSDEEYQLEKASSSKNTEGNITDDYFNNLKC